MQLTHGDELCNYNRLIRLAYEKNTYVNFVNIFSLISFFFFCNIFAVYGVTFE